MKTLKKLLIVGIGAGLCGAALGADGRDRDQTYDWRQSAGYSADGCTLRDVVGTWLFATGIGRQMLPNLPPDKDITALGTMTIGPDGVVTGAFDFTVQETFFVPGARYEGWVQINEDCTGTLTFATSEESSRTDSIAIVGRDEILGMSQDPFNLWTYQVRRIGSSSRRDD